MPSVFQDQAIPGRAAAAFVDRPVTLLIIHGAVTALAAWALHHAGFWPQSGSMAMLFGGRLARDLLRKPDSEDGARPPPADTGEKRRGERLDQVRRLVDPLLSAPATDRELGDLLDIPLANMSADRVLRIFTKQRFVNGKPNQISLGMKSLWSHWNAPSPQVEKEFTLGEITGAFTQYLQDDPRRMDDLTRQALGQPLKTPIFDLAEWRGMSGAF